MALQTASPTKKSNKSSSLRHMPFFVAELANSMQEQSQKQFKEMMELFKAKLDPSNPKGGEDKKQR